MQKLLLQILTIAYAGAGVLGLVAYWPTIKDLYHKKASANIPSYILWVIATGISFLYGLIILPDLLFILVSGMNFAACLVVLLLRIRLKR